MASDYRCFYCLARSVENLLEKIPMPAEKKKSFTLDMIDLYLERQRKELTPDFSRDLYRILRGYSGIDDPYKEEKHRSNLQALELLPKLEEIIRQSSDPFVTAIRLAIAGNVIDFAVHRNFNLEETIEKSLKAPFAADHTAELKSAVEKASSILYLGDNAGEIVFDKLFIRTMNHSNVTFAVRGMPVINDATLEDARFTGMHEVARVISNGYDAPSTLVEKSGSEFREYFRNADLIISKGQGNLEGLYKLNDKRIFFILLVKCNVIAELLGVEKNSLVTFNSSYLK
ncbi:MAG TPA: ARMT1-like domain-containing protein [Bacteroidales bacterium]|jgi:hypothetical protein|nr:ARMT1-like domain-containing protein [Bacteroidales bacterium]HOS71144.1 ARMT1-like domain-containing protein [Bacteroidales bacterium]HQH23237.1 ARMT1-like domain-containing protein [Bacteroidales bacterium]HQJ80905.1 ARMT1-like domain-containing protein [Bacteroidales bacterium]